MLFPANLPNLIAATLSNHEQTLIVSDEGNVVMVDEQEWNSIQASLWLLRDEKALNALMESISKREKGEEPDGCSVQDAFKDLL